METIFKPVGQGSKRFQKTTKATAVAFGGLPEVEGKALLLQMSLLQTYDQ